MLSVIIPAYNEELSIERAYYTISEILEKAQIVHFGKALTKQRLNSRLMKD